MVITTVLFDLDGTLLPMDQKKFMKAYFGGLSEYLAPIGYDAQKLIAAIWQGTEGMVRNSGAKTNEEVFWDEFAKIFGEKARADEPRFADFYRTQFEKVQSSCGYDARARQTVNEIKKLGYRVALATNPLFPAVATESRIHWAGFAAREFEYYTTYENSHFCKPDLKYYEEVMEKVGVKATECLMVGNDVGEDMVASELGMKVFLLTDNVINKNEEDIDKYPHGSFEELLEYVKKL